MRAMQSHRSKRSAPARSNKNHSKSSPSSQGKSCKPLKPCKPKKQIRIGGKLCEHKPVKRYKLIKSCEPKKKMKCGKLGRPPKILNHKLKHNRRLTKTLKTPRAVKQFKTLKAVKTQMFSQRKACKPGSRIKLQSQKLRQRPNLSLMDVDDHQECPSSDSSSLNLSEPVIVPRRTSTKRPMGFRALLFRLFGLNPKRRPRPPPFQF